MTEEARRCHLASGGLGACPYCGADLLKHAAYDEFDSDEDGRVTQAAACGKCGRKWLDVFRLSDVEEVS